MIGPLAQSNQQNTVLKEINKILNLLINFIHLVCLSIYSS